MVKWLSKFVLDILPSVAATIIGAYIVNHYIVPKSQTGSPAAAMATADPKGDIKTNSASADSKAADVKSQPDRPVIEKASFEKGVAEKAAIERAAERATAEKSADITGAAGRHRPTKAIVEKPAAKPPAATVAAVDPTSAPTADERRDANELARAAIDRLRPAQEPARLQEAARVPASMQPLPPPITVSTPNAEVFNSGSGATIAVPGRMTASARADDSNRLSPPGEIPGSVSGSISASRPLDLRADTGVPTPRTSVADDVMSAAKSVFHAVLPH